jgi:3-dehydroquinate synthase
MAIAARLSAELGRIPATECRRLEDLISRAGLDTELPSIIGADTMLEHMSRDKKNEAGTIKLILLSALGESNLDAAISRQTLYEFLQRQNG